MNKRIRWIALMIVVLGAWSGFAQSELGAFPEGTTTMRYEIRGEDAGFQTLELRVTSFGDGTYTLSMLNEQSGSEDDLGSFGFIFGVSSVSSGAGTSVDYSPLEALMDQRDRLQVGEDYLLPGGTEFTGIVAAKIAGVQCLEGSYIDPEDSGRRVNVAFALSQPTYISPRLRVEELRDGAWVETFIIELVEYTLSDS